MKHANWISYKATFKIRQSRNYSSRCVTFKGELFAKAMYKREPFSFRGVPPATQRRNQKKGKRKESGANHVAKTSSSRSKGKIKAASAKWSDFSAEGTRVDSLPPRIQSLQDKRLPACSTLKHILTLAREDLQTIQ